MTEHDISFPMNCWYCCQPSWAIRPEPSKASRNQIRGQSGEALIYATICLRALFTGPHVAPTDEEFDQWSSRVHIMLIMESLQRRGYVRVAYEDCAVDRFTSDAPMRVIGTWAESLRKLERSV